ncbi:hypothetical protein M3148_00410 [Georgenia satyanarayanai]|uniref:hypothetical protein n=1 Tax=Georgenia satyanarayanai TaxID=860221 RepID=UPI0020404F35|nr:hypothetical protein [Georgenia satyanarayanai]MCM3659463.1 hypothetical protein [Georgenia satyanarayanai]
MATAVGGPGGWRRRSVGWPVATAVGRANGDGLITVGAVVLTLPISGVTRGAIK